MFTSRIVLCDESKFSSIQGYNKVFEIVRRFQNVLEKPVRYFSSDSKTLLNVSYEGDYNISFERYQRYIVKLSSDGSCVDDFSKMHTILEAIIRQEVGKE